MGVQWRLLCKVKLKKKNQTTKKTTKTLKIEYLTILLPWGKAPNTTSCHSAPQNAISSTGREESSCFSLQRLKQAQNAHSKCILTEPKPSSKTFLRKKCQRYWVHCCVHKALLPFLSTAFLVCSIVTVAYEEISHMTNSHLLELLNN